MVYITGDMHGDLSRFKNPIFKKLKAGDVLIVCGDFGFIWDGSRQESHPGAVVGPKGWAVRPLKRYASWVLHVVRPFGPYPAWA